MIKSLYLPSSVISTYMEKSETKCEPITCEEMFQDPNSEKVTANHEVDKCIKCEVCSALFKTKKT